MVVATELPPMPACLRRVVPFLFFVASAATGIACGDDLGVVEGEGSPVPRRPETSESSSTAGGENGKPRTWAPRLPETKADTWTWLGPEHFDNQVKCMDGSSTGLAVNVHPGATKVILYMQGGAACFDGQTCALAEMLSAEHANEADYQAWIDRQGEANVFNRKRPENPFKDYSYVMLPYCSGDVFVGDVAKGYEGRPQHGYKNVAAYLPRLASTFREAKGVVLSGMSAGGYGAVYNFVQVQNAFDWVDVSMLDDSGPIFASSYTTPCLQEKWKSTWGMDKTMPIAGPFVLGYDPKNGVAGNGLADLFRALLDRYPKSKFALLSSRNDLVMRYFHGIGHTKECARPGLMSATFFEEALRDVRAIPNANFSTFFGPGTGHPYFLKDEPMYDTRVDGLSVAEWLGRWLGETGKASDAPRRVPATF